MSFRALCLLFAAAVVLSSQPPNGAGPTTKKKEAKLRRELGSPSKSWLDEDVVYIITDEERRAFASLQTDEERRLFVDEFWARRDPTPDTVDNEFEDEHYRRIAYANERYSSAVPGWKTDRGRTYILYGPPSAIEAHPSSGDNSCPCEDWRYRHIEGIGDNVIVEFVDPARSGDYHMTMDPASKSTAPKDPPAKTENDLGLLKSPTVRFGDLEEVVSTNIRYNTLPIEVRADYIRLTGYSVLTPITIAIRKADLKFKAKDNYARATINIFGRITNVSRQVVNTFEGTIDVETSSELLNQTMKGTAMCQKMVPLPAGMYRVNAVVKDIVGGNLTNYEMALNVPNYDQKNLADSSLIVTDLIQKLPQYDIGPRPFVIGDSEVRPRVAESFSRYEKLGIYQQFYNFAPDEKTGKPNGSIEYLVTKDGSNDKVFNYTEDVATLPGASAQQVTVEKVMSLDKLTPGQYTSG